MTDQHFRGVDHPETVVQPAVTELSILTRGLVLGGRRTALREERLTATERLSITAMALFIGAALLCKTLFWLYEHELYYTAALRPMYTFVRDWL